MSELVADASTLVDALTATNQRSAEILAGSVLHAPHLIDVEVTHALRALTARGLVEHAVAVGARNALGSVVTHRYSHAPLLERAWALRQTVSTYDAVYVALAEMLQLTLLTCDRRLARALGPRCRIELIEGG